MEKKVNFNFLASLVSASIALFARYIPLSYIWGTLSSNFSLYQGSFPAISYYNSFVGIFVYFANTLLHKKSFVMGIPSMVSGLSIFFFNKYDQKSVAWIIYFSAFFVFIYYVGISKDLIYTTIWLLLPFASYFSSLFATALKAVLVAHIVGTFLHIFLGMQLNPGIYFLLTFQSLIERLILAASFVISVKITDYSVNLIVEKYSSLVKIAQGTE